MKRIVKITLPLVALIIIAGAAYWYTAHHKTPVVSAGSAATADGEFPESQLTNLTPQINQVALNVAHLIDSGDAEQIGKVWDASAVIAQQSVARDKFVANLVAAHQTFGNLVSRQYVDTRYKRFTQSGSVPAGQYITVNYLTQFSNIEATREESFVFEFNDSQWKLAGYSILAAKK